MTSKLTEPLVAGGVPDFDLDELLHVFDGFHFVVNAHRPDHVLLELPVCVADDQRGLTDSSVSKQQQLDEVVAHGDLGLASEQPVLVFRLELEVNSVVVDLALAVIL